MPPVTYEERFTAEKDGIINKLGLDSVVELAQNTMSITPAPIPPVSETSVREESVITQWDIFGTPEKKETFTSRKTEEFTSGFQTIFSSDWWNKPLLKIGQEDLVAFSMHYRIMNVIVFIITVCLFFYFTNSIILNGSVPTEMAPNGRYPMYPFLPLGLETLLFSDEAPKDKNWSFENATSKHGNPDLKEKYKVYFRNPSIKKSLSELATVQGEVVPSRWGLLSAIAAVGAPIKEEDKGTPEYVELLRRGAPMLSDPYLKIALVIPSIIFLLMWWSAADWITLQFDELLSSSESVVGVELNLKSLGGKKLKQLKALTSSGTRGREIIYLLYTSFFALFLLTALWVFAGIYWYWKLYFSIITGKNLDKNNNITMSAHNTRLFVDNVTDTVKDVYNRYKTERHHKDGLENYAAYLQNNSALDPSGTTAVLSDEGEFFFTTFCAAAAKELKKAPQRQKNAYIVAYIQSLVKVSGEPTVIFRTILAEINEEINTPKTSRIERHVDDGEKADE
tara:strand:+ start:1364 stop:2887 length:1524 start_codon:yes stop_codon:yes gene_type:complete